MILPHIRKTKYYKEVLLQNYDINLRKKGMTYTVLRNKDAKRDSFASKVMLLLGICMLLVELVANILYLKQQSALDISYLTLAMSLVPFLLLVGSAFATAKNRYQISYINDALGYDENLTTSNSNKIKIPNKTFKSETKRQIEEIEQDIGPRTINGKKPPKNLDDFKE